MKTIEKLLSELGQSNIEIWAEGDKLCYKAPQKSLTPELLAQLRNRKLELLTFLQQSQSFQQNHRSSISPIPRNGNLPLSFAQQRLWFLYKLEPHSATYNIPAAYHLNGHLSILALEQGLQTIVQRHEILRTTFPSIDGKPSQIISPAHQFSLTITNLQNFLPEDRRAVAQQKLIKDAKQPFNLAEGPLFRASLLQLSTVDYILLLNVHHIIFDGWSFNILYHELTSLYSAFINQAPNPLIPLKIQYTDYSHWQYQSLQENNLEAQLHYWTNKLSGPLSPLQLPTDFPRPTTQSHIGSKQTLTLNVPLTQAIHSLCQQEGVTLFMLLLAALQLILHRYTGQDDIIVGTPIAGRHHIQTEPLIGIFLNNLALRTNFNNNPTFCQLLAQVRETTISAFNHQDLPFEKLVEVLQPERSLTRHPIFDIMLNVVNTPVTPLHLPGLTVAPFQIDTEPESKFPITLYAQEQQDQLNFYLIYQKALFSFERMACFLQQFEFLLKQITTDPTCTIQSYSLVAHQSQKILPNPYISLPEPTYELVPQLCTAWASHTPDAIAISQNHNWTYRDLADSVTVIARHLTNNGIHPPGVVAISGCRSFGLIAGMLGILSNGNVLLTLDQNLPQQRLLTMLIEAKAKCLLYVGGTAPTFAMNDTNLKIFTINRHTGQPDCFDHPSTYTLPILNPNDPAYIFFTSGTTGTPKGILGSHKGLAHFLHWQQHTFAISQGDRCSQLTALSFDVILREIFLPLTSGATLCLPSPEADLMPTTVLPWLSQEKITVLHTVPTLARTWFTHAPPTLALANLRLIFFAGEPLSAHLVQQWRDTFSVTGEIVNLYGPTETTLAKCFYSIPVDIPFGIQPVGTPLPATQVLVLSESNQLCGIGEPGEIIIRTPFRSLGYINNSTENQHRFISNPFREDEQDVLYRTGDRGRYRPDGTLEILGRLDQQIKIRGNRIETSEIEITLNRHPQVQDAVITTGQDHSGHVCLIAYIVPDREHNPNASVLRQFLIQVLPAYMVPIHFVNLDTLPLTSNGKVNRHALPLPNLDIQALKTLEALPKDELEKRLTDIWEGILDIHPIQVTDNFFDLGGHSLLAIDLFTQIEQVFGQKLPLSTLFQAATIAQLANVIRRKDWIAPWSTVVTIQAGSNKPPLFVVAHIMGELLVYVPLSKRLDPHQPVYGLQAKTIQGRKVDDLSREDLVRHYVKHILNKQPMGPYYLAGISSGGTLALLIAQRLQSLGHTVSLLAMFDSTGPNYPKLLPLFPRLLSVINFVILTRTLRRIINLPMRINFIIQFYGLQGLHQRILKKFGFNKREIANQEFINHKQRQRQKIEKLTYRICNQMHPVSKHINLFIFSVLARIDLDYGMNVRAFCRGLELEEESNRQQVINQTKLDSYKGKVVYFRASQRPPGIYHDPYVGWNNIFTNGMDIFQIPGSHSGILLEPNVTIIAKVLNSYLEKSNND